MPVGIFNEHFPYIETIPARTSRKLIFFKKKEVIKQVKENLNAMGFDKV